MDVETGDFPEDWVQHKTGADVCDEEDLGECSVETSNSGLVFCLSVFRFGMERGGCLGISCLNPQTI